MELYCMNGKLTKVNSLLRKSKKSADDLNNFILRLKKKYKSENRELQ